MRLVQPTKINFVLSLFSCVSGLSCARPLLLATVLAHQGTSYSPVQRLCLRHPLRRADGRVTTRRSNFQAWPTRTPSQKSPTHYATRLDARAFARTLRFPVRGNALAFLAPKLAVAETKVEEQQGWVRMGTV